MSDARSSILEKIRAANRDHEQPDNYPDTLMDYLTNKQRGPVPQWDKQHEDHFSAQLQKAGGTIKIIHNQKELMDEAALYLAQHGLPSHLVSASSPSLDDLNWPASIEVERRLVEAKDVTVITEAYSAVAETGSIVLCSGQNTPTTFNFLPDNFVCVVHKNRLVAHMEDVWFQLRQELGDMPRAVNVITGPSRTADVEQTIQIGAHGPRRLHVLLLV